MKTTLYTIKGYEGVYQFLEMHETESGTWAQMQYIGASLPFHTRPEDCTPYDYTQPKPAKGNTIASRCQYAAIVYQLDPARIHRAVNIIEAQNPRMIDETPDALIITSSNMRDSYRVTKGSCSCPDHKRGNMCKHRIAAWLYRELHPADESSRYFERRYCLECLVEHWVEIKRHEGEICHGENFSPLRLPNTYTTGNRKGGISVHAYSTPRRSSAQVLAELGF